MCPRISSSKASSSRPCAACPLTRAHSIHSFRIASPLPFELQHSVHYAGHTFPVLGLALQLFRALPGNRVEPCLPVVLARSPLRGDPSLLLQPQQRRVYRSFVQIEDTVAYLLDPPGNSESVQRPQRVERLQHHQVQRSLQHFRFAFAHLLRSFGHCIEGTTHSYAVSIGVLPGPERFQSEN